MLSSKTVNFRLSLFYFFFFAALGTFVPYWSVYLKSLGFSAAEIGELMAIVMASKVVAPYFLGWLADHYQKRLIIIRLSFVFTIIAFSGVFIGQSFWWLALIMAIFGFFWNASLPLFESLALNHLQGDVNRYSHIRLWGSVGFVALVVIIPLMVDLGAQGPSISNLPALLIFLLFITGLTSLFIKDKNTFVAAHSSQKMLQVIKTPLVFAFLLACSLQAISHGAYYTFFSIYLEEHHYSGIMTGWMWGLGVIAEVLLFVIMHHLLKRFGACYLFNIALFITALRWVILALWVDNLVFLIIAQCFHAASFGVFHASAIHLIHHLFPGKLQVRGQALYAGLSFGLGGAIGNLMSGYTWELLGSTWTFLISALIALFATLISVAYVRRERLPIAVHHE